MKSYTDVKDSRPTPLPLAASASLSDYLLRVQELGAVEGTEGGVEVHPYLRPVLDALHHVLAGGEVAVTVVHPGHPDIIHELNRRAEQATQDANALNQASGFYLNAAV